MPRRVEISIPSSRTDALAAELTAIDGVFEVQVHRHAVYGDSSDIMVALVQTRSLQVVMRCLDRHRGEEGAGITITTSEPDSVMLAGADNTRIDRDTSEGSWEEMEMIISKDSNANGNTLLLMVASGILTAVGLARNEIHIAIAGMLVAPAFMPIMRISLGLVTRSVVWRRGVVDSLRIYVALILAAAVSAWVIGLFSDGPVLPGDTSYYLVGQSFAGYWTTTTGWSLATTAAAALAGALLIVTKRSTFTSGVMIGLALVPSAALVGMFLVEGDVARAASAGMRWGADVLLILTISAAVFGWERARLHRRDMRV